MAYGGHRRSPIFDAFTLSPLPYPVLLILLTVLLLLGLSWSFSYEEIVKSIEVQLNLTLLFAPVALLILIRCLPSVDDAGAFFGLYPAHRRAQVPRRKDGGGGSPFGVAAAVVLLLIMAWFQSTFRDMWLV
ncbi:hypothetical protein QJS04_geneDACA017334 [Acorus gramineus]|uniref:Uncharacterized protein n=1 Tax=Acorus gramineus TaxID=55184 RepID=A0AAV9B9L8_ACOGR|nr:hypothetical protein QJS04_geneDACA017334 [Acorus gramineus]